MANSTAVRISSLHVSYGTTRVLRGVDLTAEAGTFTAILGSSGSGKTTLLRSLAGFVRADGGVVEIGGRIVNDARRTVPPEHRRIGYVPQDGALFPHLSVRANIVFGLPRTQRRRRADRAAELLELIGLSEHADRYPHQLSGGQQQRVALARALAPNPELVLLDEPFSALDASLRSTVRAEVIAILRATGTTAILVTHDQDEALSLADNIAVLRDGIVVQHATAQELYERPADPQLARFLGEANFISAISTPEGVDAGELGMLTMREPVGETGTVTTLVRPEQVSVEVVRDGEPADGPSVRAVVERCDYFGHDMMLTLRPHWQSSFNGLRQPETLSARLAGNAPLPAGTTVVLAIRGPVTAFRFSG